MKPRDCTKDEPKIIHWERPKTRKGKALQLATKIQVTPTFYKEGQRPTVGINFLTQYGGVFAHAMLDVTVAGELVKDLMDSISSEAEIRKLPKH